MEKADEELIEELAGSDSRLKQLYNQHRKLEKEVKKFERYLAFSSSTALKQRQLKKQKLLGMDSIMAILNQYRESEFKEESEAA